MRYKNLISKSMVAALILSLVGCANPYFAGTPLYYPYNYNKAESIGVIEDLTDQLLDINNTKFNRESRIAVTSVLYADTFEDHPDKTSPYSRISHQLQEGLITSLSRRGLNIIELRLSNTIKLTDNHEMVLTREMKELRNSMRLDYYLTGTLSRRPTGTQANLRLIDIQTQMVVATAAGFVNLDYFGQRENIEMRDGMLYRRDMNEEM